MSSVPDATRDVGSVEVSCSYSHKDPRSREQFDAHMAVMKRQKLIQIWQDCKIVAGEDWAGEIDEHLNSADIVALLVSSDFLNSDYCYEKEMKRAMERHAKHQARVVPIIAAMRLARRTVWQIAGHPQGRQAGHVMGQHGRGLDRSRQVLEARSSGDSR